MRHSRLAVFVGAMTALALMTILSACLGWVTQIIPRQLTFYISTALFALFGLKMLHEGYHMSPDEGREEYEEAQAEVQKTDADLETAKFSDMESGVSARPA
jgi:putative Ca2+/H+ antiporter (TMEM165/GDT1 family)